MKSVALVFALLLGCERRAPPPPPVNSAAVNPGPAPSVFARVLCRGARQPLALTLTQSDGLAAELRSELARLPCDRADLVSLGTEDGEAPSFRYAYGPSKGVIAFPRGATLEANRWRIAAELLRIMAVSDGYQIRVGILDGSSTLEPRSSIEDDLGSHPSVRDILSVERAYHLIEIPHGAPIPDDLAGLWVVAGRRPLPPERLKAIDAFVHLGGRTVAFFAGPAEELRGKPELHPTGLEPLLSAYGVTVSPEIVTSVQGRWVFTGDSLGVAPEPIPRLIVVDAARGIGSLTTERPPWVGVSQIPFWLSSPLVLREGAQSEVAAAIIAKAPKDAVGSAPNAPPDLGPTDLAFAPLAVTLEGRFESPYGLGRSGAASQILVVGTRHFLDPSRSVLGAPPPELVAAPRIAASQVLAWIGLGVSEAPLTGPP